MNRKEQMLYLRNRKPEKKFTFQEIGDLNGISRQRVHQIVNNNHWTGISGRPRQKGDGENQVPWEE